MRGTYSIYALVDPRDEVVRYIGLSKRLEKRYQEHLMLIGNNVKKITWIKDLATLHLQPRMDIVESDIETFKEATRREQYWMKRYSRTGSDLTNDTPSMTGFNISKGLTWDNYDEITRRDEQIFMRRVQMRDYWKSATN